jgi:hypothetical protein
MRAQKRARGGSAESPRINRRLWSEIDRPQYRKARRRFPPAANANKQRFGDKQERAFYGKNAKPRFKRRKVECVSTGVANTSRSSRSAGRAADCPQADAEL